VFLLTYIPSGLCRDDNQVKYRIKFSEPHRKLTHRKLQVEFIRKFRKEKKKRVLTRVTEIGEYSEYSTYSEILQ
jgi:hypothetical protein